MYTLCGVQSSLARVVTVDNEVATKSRTPLTQTIRLSNNLIVTLIYSDSNYEKRNQLIICQVIAFFVIVSISLLLRATLPNN